MVARGNIPFLNTRIIAQPAAGVEHSFSTPGQGLLRVISFALDFVTDATVSNRTVSFLADDGTTEFWHTCAPAVQAASLTWGYSAFAGAGNSDNTGTVNYLPLPGDGLWLLPGWRLRTSTGNIQAGDRYGAMGILFEEFPNGPDSEWWPTHTRARYEREL